MGGSGRPAGDDEEADPRELQEDGTPDISFSASVRADSLRFRSEPQTEVDFHGTPGRRSVSRSTRLGVPARVRPDEEYKDIRVDYTLASELTGDGGEYGEDGETHETHDTEEVARDGQDGQDGQGAPEP